MPDNKADEFKVLEDLYHAGIPLPRPIEWGENADGSYHIEAWIEGDTLDQILKKVRSNVATARGLEAGAVLRQIHGMPLPVTLEDRNVTFHRTWQQKFKAYADCPVHFPNDKVIFDSLKVDLPVMLNRPQVLLHGDYHSGNMLVDSKGSFQIIDFHKWGYGDPLEDLRLINRDAKIAPDFAAGLIDGYLGRPVPDHFWRILRFYVALDLIFVLPWAVGRGEAEVEAALAYAADVMTYYQNFTRLIPSWYEEIHKLS